MKAIPCSKNIKFSNKVKEVAEILKTQSHTLVGDVDEQEFYDSGLFRAAVERVRGQQSAAMAEKRTFMKFMLNELENKRLIRSWESAGSSNRFDYGVVLQSGKKAAIELKGCLDGNNTNIFERPPHAEEFILWSICQNAGADPEKNAWSGIHTRLSAEIIETKKQVDGVVIWDMVCGTLGRPCPKLKDTKTVRLRIGPYSLPPPCLYLLPSTVASPRNNPIAYPQSLRQVELMNAVAQAFGTSESECFGVQFELRNSGENQERRTQILKFGETQKSSTWTAIKRS